MAEYAAVQSEWRGLRDVGNGRKAEAEIQRKRPTFIAYTLPFTAKVMSNGENFTGVIALLARGRRSVQLRPTPKPRAKVAAAGSGSVTFHHNFTSSASHRSFPLPKLYFVGFLVNYTWIVPSIDVRRRTHELIQTSMEVEFVQHVISE
jgi:hypothetical protein